MRPTTDKTRNAVFSVLFDENDEARVLDLFCGTGSYGLEALSRGAASAVFIDQDVTYVKKNLAQIGDARTEVIKGDVKQTLSRLSDSFNIVFIDPPYGKEDPETLLKLLKDRDLLANNGVVVYEESIRTEFIINSEEFRLETEKKYGDTKVYFIRFQP